MKVRKVLGIAFLAAASVANARNVSVLVDGQKINFQNGKPRVVNQEVMVPLRGVFEKLGATVEWKPEIQTILARHDSTKIELILNDNSAMLNGRSIQLHHPATMMQGTTMVPLRFVSESFGAYVDWNSAENTVTISTKRPPKDVSPRHLNVPQHA